MENKQPNFQTFVEYCRLLSHHGSSLGQQAVGSVENFVRTNVDNVNNNPTLNRFVEFLRLLSQQTNDTMENFIKTHFNVPNKQTDFEAVKEFMHVFGQATPSTLQKNIMVDNPKLTNFRLDLIREEVRELEHAVKENDMTEVIDALCDIIYVVQGMGVAFGINMDEAFRIVHASNMSKLCRTEQEAIDTLEHYKTVPGFEHINVKYRLSDDGKYYVIYNADTGKILKSKYFTLPDFSKMTV